MTALPNHLKSLPAMEPDAVDGRVWLSLPEAAQRLGVGERQLRRQAMRQLRLEGFAKIEDRRWYIARNFDRRLDDDADDDRLDVEEIERFSRGEQRKAALMKMAAVRQFRRLREHDQGQIAAALPKLLDDLAKKFPGITGAKTGRISRATIYKWDKLYQADDENSIISLMDTRGGSRAPGGDENAWHYFASIYCDQRKPTIKTCWARTRDQAAEFGWQWTSESSCRRQLERRVPPAIQAKHRDIKRYRDSFQPYIEQSPERFPPGRVWTSDHAQMDFWVMMGDRPVRLFVTAWQDIGTRKIVGWELSPEPSSATILAAFRSAMLDDANMGGCAQALLDNGRDFSAQSWTGRTKTERRRKVLPAGYIDETFFAGIFGMLDIECDFTLPYSPQSKGTIERWFETMHDQFDRTWPTYCGSTPEDRPENLAAILKARRHIPSYEEVRDAFGRFVTGFNASFDHKIDALRDPVNGQRLSPNQAMELLCTQRRSHKEGVLDLILQAWHGRPVRVSRNGVTITVAGQRLSYGQFDPALAALKGTKRKVFISYDPANLGRVNIYGEDHQLITTATANELGTIASDLKVNRSHVRKSMKRKRAYEKAQKLLDANPELRYLSKYELLADTALEEEAQAHQAKEDRQLRAVPTPMDGAVDGGEPLDIDQDGLDESDATPQRTRFDILDFADAYRPIAPPGLAKPNEDEDIWERTRRAIQ